MQHTSPYKYKRIEVFNEGSTSNYYIDDPEFVALVHDSIVTACTALLAGEIRKILYLTNPHVIRNAVREELDNDIYYKDIVEFKNAVDNWIYQSAGQFRVCEDTAEVNAAKGKTGVTLIFDIEKQVIWRFESYTWVASPMGTPGNIPWQIIGKLNAIVLNPDTGKYFITNDRAPWFFRWPLITDEAQIVNNPGGFDPNKPWGILTVKTNITGAQYRGSNWPAGLWYETKIKLRINYGTYTFSFSNVTPFGTPKDIVTNIQEAYVTIYPIYTTLFTLKLQANISDVKTTFDQSSLPANISFAQWVNLPVTLNLPAGRYTFSFNDITNMWTPEPVLTTYRSEN